MRKFYGFEYDAHIWRDLFKTNLLNVQDTLTDKFDLHGLTQKKRLEWVHYLFRQQHFQFGVSLGRVEYLVQLSARSLVCKPWMVSKFTNINIKTELNV